jgi:uncharacterized protein YdeI (YjbR/CyaY-like superfamily)
MAKNSPEVDAYIANAADFARPILNHLRELVHATVPDATETIKWRMPCFERKGILCMMAAFKAHCAFGFWRSKLVVGGSKDGGNSEGGSMGQFGRITKLADLPADKVLIRYLKKAVALDEAEVKPARAAAKERKEVVVPDYFLAALKKNRKALAAFEKFSYSHRKEYVQWITEAKREETRNKRIATALEWLAKGKSRNWKYEK